jgi:hypothetical protein
VARSHEVRSADSARDEPQIQLIRTKVPVTGWYHAGAPSRSSAWTTGRRQHTRVTRAKSAHASWITEQRADQQASAHGAGRVNSMDILATFPEQKIRAAIEPRVRYAGLSANRSPLTDLRGPFAYGPYHLKNAGTASRMQLKTFDAAVCCAPVTIQSVAVWNAT